MADTKLNMNQRRGVALLKEKCAAKFEADIKKWAGDCKVEVNWDSLALPEGYEMEKYEKFFKDVFHEPIKKALASIATDEIGKSALKDGLKKIEIKNDKGYGTESFTFEEGTLKIDHELYSNTDDIEGREEKIVDLLSNNL